jgi:uncharacterized protein
MNRNLVRLGMALALPVALLFAGCLGLGKGTAEPTRFYLLDSLAESGAGRGGSGPSVGLGPVTIPEYLKRPHLATRGGGQEIEFAEFARWAEPLEEGVSRVLRENLSALLESERVYAEPRRTTVPPDFRILLDVLRLDARLGREAVLEARWTLLAGDGKELAAPRRSRFREAVQGKDYSAAVAAKSRALEALSRELAAAVRSARSGVPTRGG